MKKDRLILLIQVSLGIALVLILNLLGSFFIKRFDLTADNRHTPSDAAKEVLGNLEAGILVKCYLWGEMPVRYQEMRDEINTY